MLVLSLTTGAPAPVQAQEPTNSSVSAIASADKRLGYGQIARNGDKFDEFLQKHGDGAIDEAGVMVDSGKWTEKDYDAFVKYRKESNSAALVSLDKGIMLGKQAAIKDT